MTTKLVFGLVATLSLATIPPVAAARPCMLGPHDRPVASKAGKVRRKGEVYARIDPCATERSGAETMLKSPKPLPRMLGPQRDDP